MAVLANLNSAADTTDQASITTANLTNLKDQLTLLVVGCSDLVPSPNQIVITSNATLGRAPGFVGVAQAVFRGGLDSISLLVGGGLDAGQVNRTYTITLPAAATGIFWGCLRITGMTRAGVSAIRQISSIQNNTPAATPAPTFAAACLTNNPVMILLGGGTSSPGLTATGFTSLQNAGYATPTTGFQTLGRSNGFTGVTPAFTLPSLTEFGCFAVEFDISPITAQDRASLEAGVGV